ncbi:hypothetical protein 031MP002_11 [Bacillus phage 031MP002]|nr:hypothetical protein 031MP003_12 [Bacillus phage 031MP003]QFG05502.1 hypothetical protein 031MP002_11 [Bacillus phage 031MP002]
MVRLSELKQRVRFLRGLGYKHNRAMGYFRNVYSESMKFCCSLQVSKDIIFEEERNYFIRQVWDLETASLDHLGTEGELIQ